eukprot:UN07110
MTIPKKQKNRRFSEVWSFQKKTVFFKKLNLCIVNRYVMYSKHFAAL